MESLNEVKNVTIKSKESAKLPQGAKIIKKTTNVTVEEIENGYIVIKNYDIKFSLNKQTEWLYYTKKVYSEEDPIEIKEDKMLADYFD